jgi:Ni/Fe-hydrogenase subunit HybB-like protein
VLAVVLAVYMIMRFVDLFRRDALWLAFENTVEAQLFTLEIALMLIPMFFLFKDRVRKHPVMLYWSAVAVILGFVCNRLNVSVTGMEAGSGTRYVPAWTEVAVTLSIIAAGFAIFRFLVKRLPVFEHA